MGAVNNLADALALTADQQSAIGLYCGDERATLSHRITACNSPSYGAERINILAPGTENDDRNPPRTKSRHILNLSVGTDNLFHTERVRTIVRFTVVNLTNQAALYNFLRRSAERIGSSRAPTRRSSAGLFERASLKDGPRNSGRPIDVVLQLGPYACEPMIADGAFP